MSSAAAIPGLERAGSSAPALVTVGVFDGVHLGHQQLLSRLVARARAAGLRTVAVTFFPHPDTVLRNLRGRYYLTTPEEKAHLLRAAGVDEVLTLPFDDRLRRVSAADFCAQLQRALHMRVLAVGRDFALGHRREGHVGRLQELGRQLGFELMVTDLVACGEGRISSTAIRKALEAGDMQRARRWLGRSHALSGEVVRGAGRGRQLGFPTANLAVWEQQVTPANGVYASHVWLDDERFVAATNVGVRPHFGETTVTIEAFILDFDRDIYGHRLTVSFEQRLRAEQRFESRDALVAQISADVARVARCLTPGGRPGRESRAGA